MPGIFRKIINMGKGMLYKGHVEFSSRELKRLISPKARIAKLATGFRFTEGPVWIDDGQYILFSDIPAGIIYRTDKDGQTSVYRDPSHNSNGLTLDRQKRLIACEHGTRRVTRTEHDGTLSVIAEIFRNMKLNSPNDVVVSSKEFVYFTDPPFGIKPEQQEQPCNGVYLVKPERGELTLLYNSFERPNGLAFSPDEKFLYVDDSWQKKIMRFEVKDNGELKNGTMFFRFREKLPGNPDGMKVDIEGNIYCTGPGGLSVISPEGKLLGIIRLPEVASNCAWGGDDFKNLYITAQTSVYCTKTNVPGCVR